MVGRISRRSPCRVQGRIVPSVRAILFLLALLAPAAAGAEDLLLLSRAPRLRNVFIEGNERFDTGTIRSRMSLRTPGWLQPFSKPRLVRGQLRQDVQSIESFYRSRGYLRVRVSATVVRVEDGVDVTVHIDEGAPVSVIETDLAGVAPNARRRLLASLETRPGRPLSPYALDADRLKVEAYLADRGHPYNVVEDNVKLAGDRATTVFRVDPGPQVRVRSIRLQGDEGIKTGGLRRELTIHAGDRFSRRELTRSRQRLYDTGLFSDVQFIPVPVDSVPGEASIVFDLKQRKQHWFGAGVGYSSENLVRLTGEWGSRSIFGSGRRLTVSAQTARDFLGDREFLHLREHAEDISLYEPWLLGTRVRGRLTGFFHFDNVLNESVEQTTYGSTAEFTRELRERVTNVTLSFEARWVRNVIDAAVADSVCLRDPLLCRDRYRTRLASLRFVYDDRNDPLNPHHGSRQDLLLQLAGGPFGGDNNFQKAVASSSFHTPLGEKTVFSSRILIGTINPPGEAVSSASDPGNVDDVPFEDRFFSGGANTVRGYQENTLNGLVDGKDPTGGGLLELVLNAELRFPIRGPLGGILFIDAGNVWRDLDRVHPRHLAPTFRKSETDLEQLRYSIGGGIRFNSPVGPVRIEGAYRLSPAPLDRPRDVHLALGHTF